MDELDQLEVGAVEEQLNSSLVRVRIQKKNDEERRRERELEMLERQLEELSLPETQAETVVSSKEEEKKQEQRVPLMS